MIRTNSSRTRREYILIKVLGILAIALVMLVGTAGASYSYMNINAAGTAQDGYQVNFVIPWKSGMDADFSNVRFFANNINTDMSSALPYWIEFKTDGISANVWVPLPTNCNKIVCEWNLKGQTTSKSNGNAVFDDFDDFSSDNLDTSRWSILSGGGAIYQANGALNIVYPNTQVWDWNWKTRPETALALNSLPSNDCEIIITLASSSDPWGSQGGVCVYQDDAHAYLFGLYHFPYWLDHENTVLEYKGQTVVVGGVPRKYLIRKTASSYSFWMNNDNNNNEYTQVGSFYNDVIFNKYVLFGKTWSSPNNLNLEFKNFYIKKYSPTPLTVVVDPTVHVQLDPTEQPQPVLTEQPQQTQIEQPQPTPPQQSQYVTSEQPQYTPAEQTQPTPTEKPQSSSASVNLYGEKTNVTIGEDILLKLSAVNLITKPIMHLQVILIPPSGMSVFSSDFVESGAGQYTSTFDLEPGKGRDIEVRIKANQVGNFNVNGRVIYYFGNDKKDAEDYTVNLPIQVSVNSPDPIPTPVSSLPHMSGFGTISIIFVILVAFLVRRK